MFYTYIICSYKNNKIIIILYYINQINKTSFGHNHVVKPKSSLGCDKIATFILFCR